MARPKNSEEEKENKKFFPIVSRIPCLTDGLNPKEMEVIFQKIGYNSESTWNGDIKWLKDRLNEGKNPLVIIDAFNYYLPKIYIVTNKTKAMFVPHAIVITKIDRDKKTDKEYIYYNDSFTQLVGIKKRQSIFFLIGSQFKEIYFLLVQIHYFWTI